MEVFPHASAAVLAGCLPPKGARKKDWRTRVLRAQGVATDELTTTDRVDAALCALTGLLALGGKRFAPGDPKEGVIVLPTVSLPARPYRACPPEAEDAGTMPLFRECACDDPALPRAHADRVRAGARREAQVHAVDARPRGPGRHRGAEETGMGTAAGDAMRFDTAAIHAGQDPEPLYGSVNVPIYQTSTYAQDAVGAPKVWDYGRGGNPTRARVRGGARRAGGRAMRASRSPAGSAPRRRCCSRSGRATTWCSPTTSTAARTAC